MRDHRLSDSNVVVSVTSGGIGGEKSRVVRIVLSGQLGSRARGDRDVDA